jgi:hypothetical protein
MKKILLITVLLFFITSCEKDDNSNSTENGNIETKDVNVTITLPEDSNFDVSELTVSSLFTLNNHNEEGQTTVRIFDENAIEMVYATNSEGNIVLLNLVNPSTTEEVVLDSKTTAQSLAMLHPWVMNLSVEARQEAYTEISLLPEFENYHNLIIQGINSGELDPLASESITQAIGNFQDIILSESIEIEKLPLVMLTENNNIKVKNTKSSMSYSIQLFDENSQPIGDEYLVDGINKEIFSWSTVSNVVTGNFDLFTPQEIEFPVPSTNQLYTLHANTWSGKAVWRNGAKITSSIVGIVSTTLGKLIKNAECGITVGTFFWNNTNLIIQQLTNNSLTTSQAMSQLISFIGNESNELFSLIDNCPGNYSIGSQAFNNTIKALSIMGNLENGALLFFDVVDIATYESEIEFCFEKTDNDIIECDFNLEGAWSTSFISPCSSGNFYNNRQLIFESTAENSGTINIDDFIHSWDTISESTYEYSSDTGILNVVINTNVTNFAGDTGYRNFSFNGTWNESAGNFLGNFSYQLFIDNGPGFTDTNTICNGNMTLSRPE